MSMLIPIIQNELFCLNTLCLYLMAWIREGLERGLGLNDRFREMSMLISN